MLGTDGFGRSDYRRALRRHFEVDRHHVVLAALTALAADGVVPASAAADAIADTASTPTSPNPRAREYPADLARKRRTT